VNQTERVGNPPTPHIYILLCILITGLVLLREDDIFRIYFEAGRVSNKGAEIARLHRRLAGGQYTKTKHLTVRKLNTSPRLSARTELCFHLFSPNACGEIVYPMSLMTTQLCKIRTSRTLRVSENYTADFFVQGCLLRGSTSCLLRRSR